LFLFFGSFCFVFFLFPWYGESTIESKHQLGDIGSVRIRCRGKLTEESAPNLAYYGSC